VSRSIKLLAVAVLAVVLALSSAQSVFASTEIAYDDGVGVTGLSSTYGAVRFTASTDSARLVQIKLYAWRAWPGPNTVYVTESDPTTVITSFPLISIPAVGWYVMSVPGGGVLVPHEFFIAFTGPDWQIGADAAGSGRTYTGGSLATLAVWNVNDIMLRALVAESGGAVGGIVIPVNTFAVLAPWLAVIGLVGCIGTVVVVAKKRRQ